MVEEEKAGNEGVQRQLIDNKGKIDTLLTVL